MQIAGGTGIEDWRGKCVAVLGLSRSGLGATRLLLEVGARVRALELKPSPRVLERWEALAARGAELIAGPHPLTALDPCDLLIRSPGVPATAPILLEARRRGVPVLAEIELAALLTPTPVLAVTGTNGKSTTTAWTAHVLRRAGVAAVACGNIGRSFAEALLDEPEGTAFVVEVSSFQLEDCHRFHPRAAAILNLTPDHLDRHGDFATYTRTKWAIAGNQTRGDVLALGPGVQVPRDAHVLARVVHCEVCDPGTRDALFVREGALTARWAGRERHLMAVSELALPGPHNVVNAMAALALGSALVADPGALTAGLRDFQALPHRLEPAGVIAGVRFINDSKATNVDSLRVALESFPEPIILIAGGRDKQGAFDEIADLARRHVRLLIGIGEAAEKIRVAWPDVPSELASDLAAAVARAHGAAGRDGVVLLSPGCASFDMFRDYEHRGEVFKELVAQLAARLAAAGTLRHEPGRARPEARGTQR